MTYTVSYENIGKVDAADVFITADRPAGTTYVGGADWRPVDGLVYRLDLGGLEAGEGDEVLFIVQHPSGDGIIAEEFSASFHIGVEGDDGPSPAPAVEYIGVPDLAVAVSYEPRDPSLLRAALLSPDLPITFTVVVSNEGTGVALNPHPDAYLGPTYVDVFASPVSSFPYDDSSAPLVYALTDDYGIGAGAARVYTMVFSDTYPWWEIGAFYAKVDNFWQHDYGLVPESDEGNNVHWAAAFSNVYMPLVSRHR